MKRQHIKHFQSEQYKTADERVKESVKFAKRVLVDGPYISNEFKFRRYQLI